MFQCVVCANWFPDDEMHRDIIGQLWPWDDECEKLRQAAAEIWLGMAEDESEEARDLLVAEVAPCPQCRVPAPGHKMDCSEPFRVKSAGAEEPAWAPDA